MLALRRRKLSKEISRRFCDSQEHTVCGFSEAGFQLSTAPDIQCGAVEGSAEGGVAEEWAGNGFDPQFRSALIRVFWLASTTTRFGSSMSTFMLIQGLHCETRKRQAERGGGSGRGAIRMSQEWNIGGSLAGST
jgi:hypothetical protein